MGVNQQVFERYVNGDETALMGMPVQKQIKFRELRNVLSRFFGDYPERMKPEFAIALIDDQCFLAFRCLVWVRGSGGGAGRVVWGYGYHVVVHRRPATA